MRQARMQDLSIKCTFKQYLIESSVEHDLFVGRFQPFHKGHANIVKMMKNPIIAIVKGKHTSEDKQKNPLSYEQQKQLIQSVFPNATVIQVTNANLYGILHHLNKEGKNVRKVFAGEDRIESYKKTVEKSNKETGNNTVVEQTPRFTSATTVRNTIRNNDFEQYKRLMPEQLANKQTFEMLQKTMSLTEGRESEYAAWNYLASQVRQRPQNNEKEETLKRIAQHMRTSQLNVFREQLKKHQEALSKTKPGSGAYNIIKKRVDEYSRKIREFR